ncbi:MAG: DUF4838 domain-containing protein [Clostridia bacterium]|nr:DUF4838 domain-containing protein [Clostridia bacterium]
MKNIFKKVLSSALCLSFALGAFTACDCEGAGGNTNGDNGGSNPGVEEPAETADKSIVLGGQRRYSAVETDKYFMQNGKSDYKIVIPTAAKEMEATAADELVSFIEEATGFTMEIITDSNVVSAGKYISVGNTTLYQNSGIELDESVLGEAGFNIRTIGDTIYLASCDEWGALYAAYEWLGQTFNYEHYYIGFYSLDKNVKEVKLVEYDILDYPDMQYRSMLHASILNTRDELRMGLRPKDDIFIKTFNGTVSNHNAFRFLPPDTYNAGFECENEEAHECFNDKAEDDTRTYEEFTDCVDSSYHPKWYSTDGAQLCYYARGDEAEYQAMLQTFGDQCIEKLMTSEEKYLHLGHSDGVTWCQCDECKASLAKYNANSASVVLFCNDLYEYIEDYFEANEIEREFYITFFAYYGTNAAPVQYNETTGEYEAIDGLRCRDGVYVYWADTNVDYQSSFYGPNNTTYYESIQGWSAISDKIFVWTYNTNFNDFFAPFDSFNTMQDFYEVMEKLNIYYIYEQGQVQYGGSTWWTSLKVYLISKYSWNKNVNQEELTKKFFENVYGAASDTMLTLFEEFRTHCAVITATENFGGNNAVFETVTKEEFFPERLLRGWRDDIETALIEIEGLKSNKAEYDKLYKQIVLERIGVNYMLITTYGATMNPSELLELKLLTKADMELIGMSAYREGRPISGLFELWGV